ncbi:MAG: Qat anti-phage system ATPase QatA [Lachnospiraceae bacterium]|nr:Qat anti-phage system ATPase QatA [Lachnospiraceae bacterium]
MILSDNETKIDMLNNRAIAKTVAELIIGCDERPISIGVHGDWGAGKSSILAMVEDDLSARKDDIECIRFNGWKHQGFEDAKIALMSAIVSELVEKRKPSADAKVVLKKLWKNINWLSVAKAAGNVAFSAATGIPPIGLLSNLLENLKGSVSDKEKVTTAIESVGEYLSDAKIFEDNSLAKEFSEFQKSFEELLEESKIKKLVVLIDDLDRCLPKVTIETLEAVRLFMFSKSTAFVIAADEAMIEYAVRNHFPDLPDDGDIRTGFEYSKRYLEKLIQVPFRIPALGEIESGMYITLLLIGSCLKEDSPEFDKLLTVAINKMKKPWENLGFTIEQLKEALGDKYTSVINEITVSNQIADVLAKNTQGNPRKIKRFINMLLLRHKIAGARGFGDSIQIPILAKMMLAEYFFVDEYKKIATLTDDNGKCDLLNVFETQLLKPTKEAEPSTEEKAKSEKLKTLAVVPKPEKNKDLELWENNADFTAWVSSEPLLGEIDLRPYFFASKEKEDFFFDQVKSDQLRILISKLMGGTMNIASANDEIKALSPADARKVFEVLSSKILKNGDIAMMPKGIEGIKALVSQHSDLEPSLIALIETFDCKRVGVWICSGWDKCITAENPKSRLDKYYESLSKEGNGLVKAALNNTRK